MRICVNHTGEKKLWKFVRAVENGLGDCVAPTALGTRLFDFPALPGWANVCRAYGAC
jgi:hypothetical protein